MDKQQDENVYVMTYGTLMNGQHNHDYMNMAQSKFLEKAISVKNDYMMIDVNNAFPAIIKGDKKFLGELYEVPAEGVVQYLDYLEGYPTMYQRMFIDVKGINSGKTYSALIYYLTPSFIKEYRQYLKIESSLISLENDVYKWK